MHDFTAKTLAAFGNANEIAQSYIAKKLAMLSYAKKFLCKYKIQNSQMQKILFYFFLCYRRCTPLCAKVFARMDPRGFEPLASSMQTRRSTRLS